MGMDQHGGERWVGAWVRTGAVAAALTAGLVAGACAPRADDGGCDEDNPCTTRGQVCELETNDCVAVELDTSAAENPAPASFTDKVVAFHRGQICLPLEAQSGVDIPVLLQPCLHPCVTVSSYEFKHTFECRGSRCEALALTWITASSAPTGCPPEAFGSFDASQCLYDTQIEFSVATETSNGPISGTMLLEVPFLTNEDAATLAADPDDTETVDALVQQYPQQQNRIPDGRAISILSGNPAPPETCRDGACPCYPIGF
jgi:hypothetical protein